MAELSNLWPILLWVLMLMVNSRRSTGDGVCGVKKLLCSCQLEMDSRSISMNIILCRVGSNACEPCDRISETVRCRLYQYYCRQMINSNNSSSENSTSQPINYYTRCLCQNGGSCQNNANDTLCACPFGFHGQYCQFKDTMVMQITTTTNTPETRTFASVNCEIPPGPVNGVILLESDTIRTGEYISYKCSDGYTLYGNVTRYCLSNGRFAGDEPTCEKLCIIPDINYNLDYNINPNQNKEQQMIDRFGIPMITELQFFCTNNLKLQGPARIRCKDGVWDNRPPDCVWDGVSCSVPTLPSNSIQEPQVVSSPVAPETVLQYNCADGAIMKGEPLIVCTYTGTWEPQPPTCLTSLPPTPAPPAGPIQPPTNMPGYCPLPDRPNHGDFQFKFSSSDKNKDVSIAKLGTRIMYTCDAFYHPNTNSPYRECLSDGTWSGSQPQCVPECGKFLEDLPYHIINGKPLDIQKWPWQAGLYDLPTLSLFCGGSIISERWVLTAGHCLIAEGTALTARDKNTLGVFFGQSQSKVDPSNPNSVTRMIVDLRVHPEYESGNADIGLLRLDAPITFGERMRPVCLPNSQSSTTEIVNQVGMVKVAGWGSTDRYHQIPSPQLQIVNVKVVTCNGLVNEQGFPLTVNDNYFCASNDEGAPCFGDSGGGLCLLTGGNDKRAYVVEGIVSRGSYNVCATPGHYEIYTRVQKFLTWINTYAITVYQ